MPKTTEEKIKIRSQVDPKTIKILKILAEIDNITMTEEIGIILDTYAKQVSLSDLKID